MRYCAARGTDVDDKTLRIVTAAAARGDITPGVALETIERLLSVCEVGKPAAIRVADERLVWNLYDLTEYVTDKRVATPSEEEEEEEDREHKNDKEQDENDIFADAENDDDAVDAAIAVAVAAPPTPAIPRLAHPGAWWRVTAVALVLCGASPSVVGAVLWESHPTLRALVKMMVSGRYRFPTVDCDDAEREKTKKDEADLRDREADLAETLFWPAAKKRKTGRDATPTPTPPAPAPPPGGSTRASARQREKQNKLLAQKRESEAEIARAGKTRS